MTAAQVTQRADYKRPESSTELLRSCPVCRSESLKALATPGHWIGAEVFSGLHGQIGLVCCRDCGLVFVNPRPSYELLTSFYSGNTYTCHDDAPVGSGRDKADLLLGRVLQHLPPTAPRTLLDYGAGAGGFLSHAQRRGWHVRGFEPGRRGREACRRLGLDVTSDAAELRDACFGLVTLHHVFEHLPNPAEVLSDLERMLSPEGRLLLEVPNARSLRARVALPFLSRYFAVDERYRAFPIHLTYYSAETLHATLRQAGWKIDSIFTVGLGLDELFLSDRTIEPRSGGAKPTFRRRRDARYRHALRDVFLGLGLGENLVAVAHPIRNSDS